MRAFFATIVILLSLTTVQAATAWMSDYEAALKKSEDTGKPVLAYFQASDYCGWCRKLNKEVFKEDVFKTWAPENVVLLEMDFPRKKKGDKELRAFNKTIKKKYKVRGFPTVLLLDAQGNKMGTTGYRPGGAEKWTQHVSRMIAYHKNKAAGTEGKGSTDKDSAVHDLDMDSPPAIRGKLISRNNKEMIIEAEDGKRYRVPMSKVKRSSQERPTSPQ